MKLKNYSGKNVSFAFLPHGDIKEITAKEILINQLIGNEFDGSVNNLFLRIFTDKSIEVYALIGKRSESKTEFFENGVRWSGNIQNVDYEVEVKLSNQDIWFWEVKLSGSGNVDVVYGQDLGLANKGVVTTNEAYNSQYVDHSAYQVNGSYVVSSRQNMAQNKRFPYLQQGSLTKNVGFSTDGYQLFEKTEGNSYTSLLSHQENLPNEVYQFEMAYTGLQSERLTLTEDAQKVIFYGAYLENHPKAVKQAEVSLLDIEVSYQSLEELTNSTEVVQPLASGVKEISGKDLTEVEISELFPTRKVEEKNEAGELLSFFDDKDYHVVLKEKELLMERSHGHIIISGEEETIDNPVMASTLYMDGLFNSQIVLGNTTVNKFISNTRSTLNLQKKSGQRLYIKINEEWHRLGMPSAFKIGFNFGTWYYKLADDLIEVTSYTVGESRSIKLSVSSKKNKHYDFLTSFDLVMGDSENKQDYTVSKENHLLTIKPTEDSAIYNKYSDLTYYVSLEENYECLSASEFFQISTDENLLLLEVKDSSQMAMTIQGTLSNEAFKSEEMSLSQASKNYDQYISTLSNDFLLEGKEQARLDKMNALVKWYTHNMLVHYLSPHGLEQYGGAAWGTRDVCQGPVEYFFAMNKPEIVRSIILTIYANQFDDDGNWPQWFMFDKFEEIKADESHGDIIVWPLKVVGDYLRITEDFTILEELLPYSSRQNFKQTKETETLLQHIEKQIQYMEDNFLEGTYLSCYGDGDWDDTLQPADQSLKKNMASSWTVALTYQTMKQFFEVMTENNKTIAKRSQKIADGVYQDFHKYMLQDEVIPGFLFMSDTGETELMVHPNDTRTGIDYRLLPMTRSMISELIDQEEVNKHYDIIQEHLKYPDAVRLMNKPANYEGGVSEIFKRAEQAANLGREVGLAYIHAHIRYIEAMAKIGKPEETWQNLEVINPIGIFDVVSNSELRQGNAYFSSSDGNFKTRYDAKENFEELKTKERTVKGGWRIYSSGPGIYLNQLISNVLGIRKTNQFVIFDPVLPQELDGVTLNYTMDDRPLKITYHLNSSVQQLKINGKLVAAETQKNRYRNEGLQISLEAFNSQTKIGEENELEIFIGEM
ncbi:GH36-type glycosyl hydrolase domain-containing protein [Vagococcus hydrophili]|uniref:Cellobiose phosphorylase n=1 Tax=Vagococcus hydrophili TaxID=2714947 RepID=A0A6G8AUS8_9ENTE|nr:cellobiose phosphorylase [Vagococcus hydrophili]QIL48756.1 cellobiose phosphorylase [Vagococcus hydrophili]